MPMFSPAKFRDDKVVSKASSTLVQLCWLAIASSVFLWNAFLLHQRIVVEDNMLESPGIFVKPVRIIPERKFGPWDFLAYNASKVPLFDFDSRPLSYKWFLTRKYIPFKVREKLVQEGKLEKGTLFMPDPNAEDRIKLDEHLERERYLKTMEYRRNKFHSGSTRGSIGTTDDLQASKVAPRRPVEIEFSRGIKPAILPLYQQLKIHGVFVCLNDKLLKKKFSFSVVNDDFCDCEDGTDEPGTSACPNGQFYCDMNTVIPSSMVDDGICDCCDGTDELFVSCPARPECVKTNIDVE